MKLTIITPTFNSASCLGRCVESVASQLNCDLEQILIDGGSTDGTLAMIKALAERHPFIRYISEKDRGIYDAMNKGVRLATGDYVLFLGSDDLLYNDTVVQRALTLIEPRKPDLAYGNVQVTGPGLHATQTNDIYDGEFTVAKLLQKNICHQSILYSLQLLKKVGEYNINYRYFADWEYNLRCFAAGTHQYIDVIVAYYNTSGVSIGGQDLEFHLHFFDDARKHLGASVFHSAFKTRIEYLGFVGRLKLKKQKDWRGLLYLFAACWHSPRYIFHIGGARSRRTINS